MFLPYVSQLADYLDLVAAVEDTCEYLHTPVWLEGYPPPADLRLRSFSITPDPGVLEVNLPPASNWDELEQFNTLLFKEARHNRLTAEKFGYDGSHLATGGGSHIVVGGATVTGQPIPAPSRFAPQHVDILAKPSLIVVSFFRDVCWPDQPVSAPG